MEPHGGLFEYDSVILVPGSWSFQCQNLKKFKINCGSIVFYFFLTLRCLFSFYNWVGRMALFTVTFSHLHYNVFERECEAISGKECKIARNCLTSTLKNIVMQIRNGNCEKGYWAISWSKFGQALSIKSGLKWKILCSSIFSGIFIFYFVFI